MFDEYLNTPELADIIPLKVAAVDEDARYIFINKTFENWLGCDRSEIKGMRIGDVSEVISGPPGLQTNEERYARIKQVIREGSTEDFDLDVMLVKTGKIRTISVRLVGDTQHGVAFMFFRDITEIKENQVSEAKLRAVVDTASDGIIVIEPDGKVLAFNAAAEKQFGYSADEVVGQNVKMIMPEATARNHDGYLEHYAKTRKAKILGKGRVVAEGRRKDGSVFPVELAVNKFEVNGKLYFTGSVHDITERKQHEKEVREWNENLEAEVIRRGRTIDRVFNLSSDILGTVNFEGYFTSISPSAERITGLPPAESLKKPFLEFVHPDDQAEAAEIYRLSMTGSPIGSIELRVVNQLTDAISWTQWTVQPDMEMSALYVVGRDITVEKAREEQLRQSQKMEAIGQLTGGIAHDFNNLLMGISGCVELIEQKLDAPTRKSVNKYIEGASASVERAASLTHRLLAFSRRQPLSPTTVSVNSLIQGMEDLIQRTIGQTVRIVTELGEGLSPVTCDTNQLEAALLNLIINARDALDGDGKIVIKTEKRGAAMVGISVTDDGMGMDDQTKDRAFDPFFTTKPIGQGTGLGLSMLHGFVSQSGGTVCIDSVLAEGTTVTIALPCAKDIEEFSKPTICEVYPQETLVKIVIVEDEPVIRTFVEDALSDSGYTIKTAEDGNQAIALFEQEQVDLLITDVGLPGMKGRQVAEEARRRYPEVCILFITGYAAGVTERNELVLANSDMLLKPFTVAALRDKVSAMVREPQSQFALPLG